MCALKQLSFVGPRAITPVSYATSNCRLSLTTLTMYEIIHRLSQNSVTRSIPNGFINVIYFSVYTVRRCLIFLSFSLLLPSSNHGHGLRCTENQLVSGSVVTVANPDPFFPDGSTPPLT